MQNIYTLPVGTDKRDLVLPSGQIAGVLIDNPSGSWLKLSTGQYVPPYTIGWSVGLTPRSLTIDVLFVDSPSGSPSELVGSPVTVTVTDQPTISFPGEPSGAQQSQSPVGARVLLAEAQITVFPDGTGGPGSNIIAPLPDSIIVPVRLYASASSLASSVGVTGYELRDQVVISVWDLTIPAIILPTFAISPETPFANVDFPQGTKLPVGEPMTVRTYGHLNAGIQVIEVTALYYRERA